MPRLALALALALAALILPTAGANATTLTGVNLSEYTRVARHDLPEGAREASGHPYDPVTDSLFVIGDEGSNITHVTKAGALIDTMRFEANNGSPSGTDFYDTEGIAYAGTSGGKP